MERLTIEIKDNGIFCPGFNGAIGKTYIGVLAEKENQLSGNNDIGFITYSDILDESLIISQIENFTGHYLFLDRLDLYITDPIITAIKKKSAVCAIILDLKNTKWWRKMTTKFVKISRDESGVRVVQR